MISKYKKLMNRGSEHFYYVGATVISALVHFVYSVFVKAHIEPVEYGMYSSCLLLQTYMAYAQLGTLNSFNRDYPQLIGAGDDVKATKYRNAVFTYIVLVFSILTVIVSTTILIFNKIWNVDDRYTYGLILCAVITTVTLLENFLASRVRIDGGFRYTSIVLLVELTAVVLGILLIPRLGYYTLYIVTIISMLIGIVMFYKKGIADLKLSFEFKLLKTIVISGIPLLINGLIWTIVNSIDKFVILGFMDAEALGIYSIAQMAFSYIVLIPTSMSQLFYVKLGKIYGATNSIDELNDSATKYTLIISIVISYVVLGAYYFMQPLVDWIMPKYSEGVASAKILMIGLAIYAPTMVNGNILTILKKNAALIRGSIYLCVLNAVCSIALILLNGANIESVAIGTGISYLLRTIILIIQLKNEANTNVVKMINASIVPVLIIAGPGIAISVFVTNIFLGFIISAIFASMVTLFIYMKNLKEILRG